MDAGYRDNRWTITRFHPVTASGLDPALHFVRLLCCLHVFKPFLVLSSCLAFRLTVATILADASVTPPSQKWPKMCRLGC